MRAPKIREKDMKHGIHIAPLLLFFAYACADDYNSNQKVIIGENNLTFVSIDDPLAYSVGRLNKGCTAWHIGNGIVITAGHCIELNECTEAYSITWGLTEDRQEGFEYSECKRVINTTRQVEKDFAILEVNPIPKAQLNVSRQADIGFDQTLRVLSYPAGRALSDSGPCQAFDIGSETLLRHDCDTEIGSSGAPLINEQGEVIGIHMGGSTRLQINTATRASVLLSFLGEADYE